MTFHLQDIRSLHGQDPPGYRYRIAGSELILILLISKKSLNFENSRVLQSSPEFSRVLKVQRFFADVMEYVSRP